MSGKDFGQCQGFFFRAKRDASKETINYSNSLQWIPQKLKKKERDDDERRWDFHRSSDLSQISSLLASFRSREVIRKDGMRWERKELVERVVLHLISSHVIQLTKTISYHNNKRDDDLPTRPWFTTIWYPSFMMLIRMKHLSSSQDNELKMTGKWREKRKEARLIKVVETS